MQSRTAIPAPRLPPPRRALQDVTARANLSPAALPPMLKAPSGRKSSKEASFWARMDARTRDEADALRDVYKRTAVDVERHVPQPTVFRIQRGAAAASSAPPARATASASRKRKSDESPDDAIAAYKQDLDHIYLDYALLDLTCTEVRALIRKVLDRGIFKKGEFCQTIGCSNNAVNRFLERTGPDGGAGSDVYTAAWRWFKQRELAGLGMPAASPVAQTKAKTAAAARPSVADLSSIHLDGEEIDFVPVYETCDVVRRKIAAHLGAPGVTLAQFCRNIHAQLRRPQCKSIQSTMLKSFIGKRGPVEGCTSSVYYAAYVYFEKLRIAEGKPKSRHRLEMEKIHPGGR